MHEFVCMPGHSDGEDAPTFQHSHSLPSALMSTTPEVDLCTRASQTTAPTSPTPRPTQGGYHAPVRPDLSPPALRGWLGRPGLSHVRTSSDLAFCLRPASGKT
jgi:hypothetical protein